MCTKNEFGLLDMMLLKCEKIFYFKNHGQINEFILNNNIFSVSRWGFG